MQEKDINSLNGMSDLMFQQIFCTPSNEKLLKSFLEDILDIDKIHHLKVLSPVIPIERLGERRKIADLLVEADDNIINIEINKFYYKNLNRRNYGYISSVYGTYLDSGKALKNMPNFIQVNLNTNLPKYFKNKYYEYGIFDEERKEYFVDNQKIIMFNVDKIKKLYYNKGNQEVLENAPRYAKYLIMLHLTGEELKNYCKGDDEVMATYNKKFNKLTTADLANVFLSFDDEERVKEEIRSDGFDEGKAEEKANVAKKMLKKKIPFKEISELTGLSNKEIHNLKMTI